MKIEMLSLRNFKCHANLDLPLNTLTVLTGFNSAGKSSIHQALALLAQSDIGNARQGSLQLKGQLVDLGVMGDVLNLSTGHDAFQIGLVADGINVSWRVSGDRRQAMLKAETVGVIPAERLDLIMELVHSLVYLTTSRPPIDQLSSTVMGASQLKIGSSGEGAVALLYALDQFAVTPNLCIENVPPTLPRQVEAWMAQFFPGLSMDIQPASGAPSILTLGLRTSDKGEFHNPANVGFGLLYLLPIVTALLHTKPSQLLIIETPEAHIHPSAQSLMGVFLARVAATGVQIIVETHSDHLINGVRRAVQTNLLSHDAVVIHFFSGQQNETAKSASIMIDPRGNLGDWPAGFCDQYDQDLAQLTGWGSGEA